MSKGSRIVIIDEQTNTISIKSDKQIIQENEEMQKLFAGSKKMTESDDKLKEAIRQDDFAKMMERKRAEKATKEATLAQAVIFETDQQEVAPEEEAAPMPVIAPPVAILAPAAKTVAATPAVSLRLGVIGCGQAGGKIAQVFYNLGYDTVAVNTAKQDLELLKLPEDCKFLLASTSLGGAGKDLEVGRGALEEDYSAVRDFIIEKTDDAHVLVLCVSGGGGTGSGAASTMVRLMNTLGKPVVVIFALTGSTDDTVSKSNTIKTLSELAEMASKDLINSLILVDNTKIELAFTSLSPSAFWETANKAIVEPLHIFNTMTSRSSNVESMDSADFTRALLEGGGCTIFGTNKVSKEEYEDNELALVSCIVDNLEKGLLASGFNLKEAQSVGVLITANKQVLASTPYNSLSFIFKYISEEFASARTFKGIYEVPSDDDDITINFIFSGLSLPRDRIESLKNEAAKGMTILSDKKKDNAAKMTIATGSDKATTSANQMMDQIRKKKGVVGQLIKGIKKDPNDRRR